MYRSARTSRGEATDNRSLLGAIGADVTFRRSVIDLVARQSAHAATHLYNFGWRSPLFDGAVGACHVLELPFVFGTFADPAFAAFSGADLHPDSAAELSERIQRAWVGFAANGEPGWPAFDTERRATQLFGPADAVVDDAFGDELRAWAKS